MVGMPYVQAEVTGAMRTGLAEAWRARVQVAAEENAEWHWQTTALILGQSLCSDRQYGEAERMPL